MSDVIHKIRTYLISERDLINYYVFSSAIFGQGRPTRKVSKYMTILSFLMFHTHHNLSSYTIFCLPFPWQRKKASIRLLDLITPRPLQVNVMHQGETDLSCPNSLFLAWVGEWMEKAKTQNSNGFQIYKRVCALSILLNSRRMNQSNIAPSLMNIQVSSSVCTVLVYIFLSVRSLMCRPRYLQEARG